MYAGRWNAHAAKELLRAHLGALQKPAACNCATRALVWRWSDDSGLAGNIHRLALAVELGLETGYTVVEHPDSSVWKGYARAPVLSCWTNETRSQRA
jgi:hypothetical protein